MEQREREREREEEEELEDVLQKFVLVFATAFRLNQI